MKKLNKSSLSALLIIFGFFVMTLNFWDKTATFQPNFAEDFETNESLPNTSQFIPRNIRIAIYDEPNVTNPTYTSGNTLTNNYTALILLLESAGFDVTTLTCADIYNHALMTADFDIFIMADNLPRENITNQVKEFWLGGGGVLSFDSALPYLFYFGIIIPEYEGDDGKTTYWGYSVETSHNISMRHPITKEYQINDKFSSAGTSMIAFDWSLIQGTSVGSEIVKLANREGINNHVSAVALHRSDKGGPIAHLPGRGDTIGINMSDLIIDSIEWLCPRPKGRILFDLSHLNAVGVDTWDGPYVQWSPIYSIMRDNLVNRSYTFDKLYPSALGNFTTDNLAPYDLLIVNLPDINFTASEVTNIRNWVNNGGGILALGDNYFYDGDKNLNYLLSSFDLSLIDDSGTDSLTTSFEHPTEEGCSSLTMVACSLINYTSNAYPLWGNSPTDICIAGEEYGNGRVILTSDVNIFDNSRIGLTDNAQFSINVANWLTASQAKVLILITDHPSPDPNDNVYKGPVATALNDLGIKFYLTFTCPYFNLSLTNNDFQLTIVDQNAGGEVIGYITQYASDIINYMENGGCIIINSDRQCVASPLWDYLGYTPVPLGTLPTPPVVYIWNTGHRIFTTPAHYNANNITTSLNLYTTDFINVTLYNNATGIAGLTNIASVDGNAIILSVNGRAISNTFAITEYYDDTDDSTYPDALEIWENEIAYMLYQTLSVGINNPHTSDIFSATAPDFIITTTGMFLEDTWYTLNDGAEYHISSTSGALNSGAWDGLPEGDVSLKFYVEDLAGNSKYAGVNIVKDSQGPHITITSPSAGDTFSTTAPSFIVEIIDEHLDKMWYTLNSGSTKYFFTANGSIDQSAWDALADGSITIRFYANDTVSNETFATFSVEKSIVVIFVITAIIIGVVFVFSAIIIRRQLKQRKSKN